ncbi:MAG: hypothetical protein ABSA57_07020 [Candidatus Acidiferrales bacterium]
MADLLPSRIEPLGDSAGNAAESRRERPPQPKVPVKPAAAPPPLDPEPEQDEAHQLDELA